VRVLRRSVSVEVVFALVVFAMAGILVNSVPAKQAYETGQSYNANIATVDKKYLWEVEVDNAVIGPNEFHLTLVNAGRAEADPLMASAQISLPSAGIAPITIKLVRLGPGHYYAHAVNIPIRGKWRLTMRAQIDQFNETSAATDVPIS
jgi:copper transport protein